MEILILSLWVFVIGGGVLFGWWAIKQLQPTPSPRYARIPRQATRRATPRRTPAPVRINTSSRDWQELMTLLQGDQSTAMRLIEAERRKNPTRSLDWCVEKAVWQLKRDRR